jgi:hypothetical protein
MTARKISPYHINDMFNLYFGRFTSSFFPMFITRISRDVTEKGDENLDEIQTFNYHVVEAYEENPDMGFREIAKISMKGYSPIDSSSGEIYITFEGIQEGKNRWYQVEKLVHSFVDHLWKSGASVASINPNGFIPIGKMITINDDLAKRKFYGVPLPTGIPGNEKESKLFEESPKPIGLPIYIPKKEDVLANYKKAYALFRKLDKEYDKEWDKDSENNNPKPKLEDYRDALAKSKMKWKTGEKTIQRIIDAGDVGFVRGSYKKKK